MEHPFVPIAKQSTVVAEPEDHCVVIWVRPILERLDDLKAKLLPRVQLDFLPGQLTSSIQVIDE